MGKRGHHVAFASVPRSRFYGNGSRSGPPPLKKGRPVNIKLAVKTARSRTMTMTKRKKSRSRVKEQGQGQMSYARHNLLGSKLPKKVQMTGAPLTWIFNQCANTTWGIGTQGNGDAVYVTDNDLKELCSQARAVLSYDATGGTTVKAATGGNKVYVKYATGTTWYTNSSTRPVMLELNDYVTRRDSANSYTSLLSGTIANPNPPAAIGGGTIYSISAGIPFVKPTDQQSLTPFYRITKRTKVWLAPGETHVHKVFVKFEKLFDIEVYNQGTVYLKGWTFGTHYCAKSTPVHGSTGGYDLGNGEIIIYANLRLVGRAVVQTTQATSGQYVITSVSGTDQYVSVITGLVENVATALNAEVV